MVAKKGDASFTFVFSVRDIRILGETTTISQKIHVPVTFNSQQVTRHGNVMNMDSHESQKAELDKLFTVFTVL